MVHHLERQEVYFPATRARDNTIDLSWSICCFSASHFLEVVGTLFCLPAGNVCQAQKLADVDSELAAMLFSRLCEVSTVFQHTNREASVTRRRKLERMLSVRRREAQEGDCGKKASLLVVTDTDRQRAHRVACSRGRWCLSLAKRCLL